jgi:hypothetical protein
MDASAAVERMTGLPWDAPLAAHGADLSGGVALLYSGGCDSTLAACRLAEHFDKVSLVTFTRFGFLETDNPDTHAEQMHRRYPNTTFERFKIPYGRFYEEVESYRKLRSMFKYGTLTSIPCGHCKVAMHWRNVIFCLENGIRYAADGSVTSNDQFAEQNPRILMPEIAAMYAKFGITLLHPVHEEGLDTEAHLFRLGITDSPQVKRTTKDKQVICSQHILFAMVMRQYLVNHTLDEYETNMKAYLTAKVDHLASLTAQWADTQHRAGSRIARLMEAE